ncbi:ankyrin repeat domain-containing protein [Sphingomonas sanxanigenens]|uniref:Uncharacterized protein n=1 Tax=Sphingomonas sanxanigenens DSM 19645 = NX02 TaxID=1123269 RepID=W0AFQ7_9SPHN|nr:ankyrin repeat domain-containing protein [Sphingomonas sanxanigenens]AHE55946.1 hypothetical protein NX02_21575 [Sphingomonas sanxanigenens DSM 19645 = NX02]
MPEHASQGEPAPLPPRERLQDLLFDAARLGRADMIPALHRAGIDLEATDLRGYTALILASYNGSLETTRALLDLGAAVDTPDTGRGNTALMGVAFKGYRQILLCLLEAGAAVDRRNLAGQTALMTATLFGHAAIVEDLLAAGANPLLVDIAGNSARSLAGTQGNVALLEVLDSACPPTGTLDG